MQEKLSSFVVSSVCVYLNDLYGFVDHIIGGLPKKVKFIPLFRSRGAVLSRHLWPRVVVVSYFMLRMLADSVGKGDWKAVSVSDQTKTYRIVSCNKPKPLFNSH